VTWLLLVYTIPAQPPGPRAAVWRELKRIGAVYLRDGVAVLPEREETRAMFEALVARIQASAGQATLVSAARLDPERHAAVLTQACADRATEYAAIAGEATRFLDHIESERTHWYFTAAERSLLATDLAKLRHWLDQIRARDYFDTGEMIAAGDLLDRCAQTLATLSDETRHLSAGATT
jgi:hypothetical protein